MTNPSTSAYGRCMTEPPPIIVIGASEGGVEALSILVANLPSDLDAAVFLVLHIGAHQSRLPSLLTERGPLPARHPDDGDPIRPGHIYVAPPDHHLVLEPGRIRLTRGPRENWARPAVDPLFRSAAAVYGEGVIGVILTGGLNDGTAGLHAVAQHGGTTVVQDPDSAVNSGMPRSALRHVAVDHCVPLSEIAALLTLLVAKSRTTVEADRITALPARREDMTADYKLDRPVAVTCPDCGGALRRSETGTLKQYECHIGHVYTADVMVAAQFSALEWSLTAALRALSERGELCRQMARDAREGKDEPAALRWDAAEAEAKERAIVMRRLIEEDWLHVGESESRNRSSG